MNQVRTRDRGWVRALNSVVNPAVRLVCFPYSGGAAATYRAWAAALPADFQLLAVQYPGHADRITAAPAGSIAEMGSSVAEELARLDPARCALFGHSLGAVVAYETAKALQGKGTPADCLFVSGAAAPSQAGGGTTHRVSDGELWSALKDLGGIEADVAENAELRELLLPVLRSDITLHETYRPAPHTEPLHCQVRCYYNTEDPLVDSARLVAWAAVGTGRFGLRAWPGGHFESLTDSTELIADIVATLGESEIPR